MPTLTMQGLGAYHFREWRLTWTCAEFDQAREQFSEAGVATAIAFLRNCRWSSEQCRSSYRLKHAAEDWGWLNGMASYVANGELIVAAAYLDYPMSWSLRSLNAVIGVSVEDVERLVADWGEAEG